MYVYFSSPTNSNQKAEKSNLSIYGPVGFMDSILLTLREGIHSIKEIYGAGASSFHAFSLNRFKSTLLDFSFLWVLFDGETWLFSGTHVKSVYIHFL